MNDVLTIEEVAKFLHVSRQHLYKLLYRESDPLPSVRISEMSVRIIKSELDKWLERQTQNEKK